ncbi:DUF6361 family protein [Pseudalkalibacillus salsuginis]|uniref:DUF6361 family protein n=1 Tax=Pseudalkalibacillus salsuginis TaxID=2910972 RepID=UPI001F3FE82D|nr:DUF6361 family protein [Pseudalkalibacillus salsuginis]MCF6409590.1 DUF6361 family protein [Pseudalkalibacillus salsuginis]
MNAMKLGWIDYSSEHKNKVMAVLDLLSDKGAIDELGIGLIRDGFADVLFPGTSTLQTRAKYFFIIPYLMMDLEKERHSSPGEFLEKLGSMEVDVIETLLRKDAEGVIGARAGKKLKRKPSSVYWSGLKTFEIFKHDLTLNNYAKAVFRMQRNKESLRSLGNEESDDLTIAGSEYTSTYWQCLIPESNWKENLSMDLTFNEAGFLKDRMIKSRKSKDSLLAFLLQQNPSELEKIDDFDAIGEVFSLPDGLSDDYAIAKNFSMFIAGANIRYNVILSNHENKEAIQEWKEWKESSFIKNEFPYFRYQDVLYRLKINNPLLKRFLSEWQKTALSNDETMIDELLIKREIELKSKERAKLYNTKFYAYEEGKWLGSKKLQYRFRNSKDLMVDILSGLEGGHA